MECKHNIAPLWNENSEILILGSFPSIASRDAEFFYAHPKNRFWRVLAELYNTAVPCSVKEKKDFLQQRGIALWDVIASCEIHASSDSSIKKAVPNDISFIVENSNISRVFLNGGTAARLYKKHLEQAVLLPFEALPSTSPANARISFEELVEQWRTIVTNKRKV